MYDQGGPPPPGGGGLPSLPGDSTASLMGKYYAVLSRHFFVNVFVNIICGVVVGMIIIYGGEGDHSR